MTVAKPNPKQLLRPITTGADSAMNQSQFLAITCNSLKAREKSRVHGAIGFASRWWKNWRESCEPITKRSDRNHVITFDCHLKIALKQCFRELTLRLREDKWPTIKMSLLQLRNTVLFVDTNPALFTGFNVWESSFQ